MGGRVAGRAEETFSFFSLSMWKHLVPPELGETKKYRCFQVGSIINIRSNTRSIPFYYAENAPFSYKKVLLICLRIQSAWSHPNKTDLLCAFSSLVTRTHVWLSLSYWKNSSRGMDRERGCFLNSTKKRLILYLDFKATKIYQLIGVNSYMKSWAELTSSECSFWSKTSRGYKLKKKTDCFFIGNICSQNGQWAHFSG